jgi:hypothetical protein
MIARCDPHPIQMFFGTGRCRVRAPGGLTLFVAAQAAPTNIPSVDLEAAPSHSQIVQTMEL